jgi:L-alanine-DL-glutamate epimerase-like enolase superfamily enzyme
VIKLIKTGGIEGARRIAAITDAAGIGCVLSTPFNTPVAARPRPTWASRWAPKATPPSPVETALVPGRVARPRGPGLGVAGLSTVEVSWDSEHPEVDRP